MNRAGKFIIDTNTLISSLFLKGSTTFKALEKAQDLGFLIFSDETFLEFEMVLMRRKFDKYFSKDERLQIIEKFHAESTFVAVISSLQLCRDPKDDKFLNLAIDTKASCIITGDKDLLVLNPLNNIPILLSVDFLESF